MKSSGARAGAGSSGIAAPSSRSVKSVPKDRNTRPSQRARASLPPPRNSMPPPTPKISSRST